MVNECSLAACPVSVLVSLLMGDDKRPVGRPASEVKNNRPKLSIPPELWERFSLAAPGERRKSEVIVRLIEQWLAEQPDTEFKAEIK